MDGVIADFDQEVINQLRARYPEIPILESRSHWYISDDYPDHSRLIRDISDKQGFFENLPLIENALEGWQRLIDFGYHPVICSSPLQSNPYSRAEKLSWLKRVFAPKFGQSIVDQAIIDKNKHLHEGFAIIDDNPIMPNSDEAGWQHILFRQEYNKSSQSDLVLEGWLDEKLPELLKKAIERSRTKHL